MSDIDEKTEEQIENTEEEKPEEKVDITNGDTEGLKEIEDPKEPEGSELAESSEEAKPQEEKKAFQPNPKVLITLAAVAVVVAAVLLVVLMIPSNRVKRYTGNGNTAFAAGKYEKALNSYKKALSIDEHAYVALNGAILSAGAMGDGAARYELCMEALSAITDRDTALTDQETASGMELLLTAYEYLNDFSDGATVWAKLQEAFGILGEPGELRPMMSEYAFNYARALTREENPEAITYLDLFTQAYDYADGSEPVAKEAGQVATAYVENLLSADSFDEAREIINTYGDKFTIDKEGLLAKIDNAERLYETKISFLTQVYENMGVYYEQSKDSFHEGIEKETEGVNFRMLLYDWFEMQNLDGSEAADTLALSFDGEPQIFSPEGYSADKTVTACGLYPYGGFFENDEGKLTTSYYFFLGNYVNGKRQGYGISFVRTGETSFYVFEGMWENDAPNGYGILYRKNNYAHTQLAEYTDVLFANYVDGYQDGTVLARITANENPGIVFEGTFEVKDGVGVEVPSKTDEYELLNPIPEGYVLIGVIPSISDGYANYMIYRDVIGEKKGTIGY